MATHASMLAWEIPWTERRAWRLQSMGLQRVRQDRGTKQGQQKQQPPRLHRQVGSSCLWPPSHLLGSTLWTQMRPPPALPRALQLH